MFVYLKLIIIFVLLSIHFAFSDNFINATGFNESYSLRGGLATVNEGGIFFNKMIVIYKISSKIKPERVYIGSAINAKSRKEVHFSLLKNNSHFNRILQNHVNKYGIEDLSFEILEPVMFKEDLIKREQFYLDTLNPYFNICKVAGSILGIKRTNETKKKMSESQKGRKPTLESRIKMSIAQKKRITSEETKRKQSKANKGKAPYKMTDEIRKNISKAMKGKPSPRKGVKLSDETKKKISKAKKGQKGYWLGKKMPPTSEKTKQKLSKSLKRYWAEKELLAKELLKEINIYKSHPSNF